MQAFKRYCMRKYGKRIGGTRVKNGMRYPMYQPAQVPMEGCTRTGRYRPPEGRGTARAEFYALLDSAAVLRAERQAEGAYAYVVGARAVLEAARMCREMHVWSMRLTPRVE